MNVTIDVPDRLQAEKEYVRLVLVSGKTVYGKPDCIVWDEDENGDELEKRIRFETWGEPYAKYYGVEDIRCYERIAKEELPSA